MGGTKVAMIVIPLLALLGLGAVVFLRREEEGAPIVLVPPMVPSGPSLSLGSTPAVYNGPPAQPVAAPAQTARDATTGLAAQVAGVASATRTAATDAVELTLQALPGADLGWDFNDYGGFVPGNIRGWIQSPRQSKGGKRYMEGTAANQVRGTRYTANPVGPAPSMEEWEAFGKARVQLLQGVV